MSSYTMINIVWHTTTKSKYTVVYKNIYFLLLNAHVVFCFFLLFWYTICAVAPHHNMCIKHFMVLCHLLLKVDTQINYSWNWRNLWPTEPWNYLYFFLSYKLSPDYQLLLGYYSTTASNTVAHNSKAVRYVNRFLYI